ncbi:hypothetical protein TWF730_001706 [Orbilia blumenaviensis]|uniref:Uncharacterized protein n=1 Tax=Orbilia blumenaviensis TaxID=1796055 RepID=A0AAV9UPN3_9PEZI
MPCSILAGALEPPLAPNAWSPTHMGMGMPMNPQMGTPQTQTMQRVQQENSRIQLVILQQQQIQIAWLLHSVHARRIRQLPVPSQAEINATVADINNFSPQMIQIHPRVLDHYRIQRSRNSLLADNLRRSRASVPLQLNKEKCIPAATSVNTIIGRIKEANSPSGDSCQSRPNSFEYPECRLGAGEMQQSIVPARLAKRTFEGTQPEPGEMTKKPRLGI